MAGRAEEQTEHRGVLRDEVVDTLCRQIDGAYVDATFGRGGHARAMLAVLGGAARLLVIDRDPAAIAVATALARADSRVEVRHGRFGEIDQIAAATGFDNVVGVVMDLGVSSPQLDDPSRGFSFRADGPLDMRMDPDSQPSAAGWLAAADELELARVFHDYGEERYGRRIARAIVERRRERPIVSTGDLVAIIEANQPRPDPHKHAATRVFQAIRLQVNGELEELEQGLSGAYRILADGGRLAVISFHSLEDRIVKRTFNGWVRGPQVPRRLPVRNVGIEARARTIGKPRRANETEVRTNPRARSALLRVVEKIGRPELAV